MNSFICSTERPFKFRGTFNEDVNTYCFLGSTGHLMFTYTGVSLTQKTTQSNAGGITDLYLRFGTYVKAFMTVMYCPSFVKVSMMGSRHRRIHHRINWRNAVPVILDESYKKRPRKGRAKKEAKEAVEKV